MKKKDPRSVDEEKIRALGFDKLSFDKKNISLDELLSGGPGKDGIPSIDNPKFISVKESELKKFSKEPLIVLNYNHEIKAYPLRILMWHEIVNDVIGGKSTIITFCPLCNAGIVFDTHFEGKNHHFGVSGMLRNSDMVYYDDESQSLWQQFTGEGLVGKYTGQKLKQIPSMLLSYEKLVKKHPNALVLSSDTGFEKEYGKNPYVLYDEKEPFFEIFPIDSKDKKLSRVVGFFIGEKIYHFSCKDFKKIRVRRIKIGEKLLKIEINGKHNSALNKESITQSKLISSISIHLIDKVTKKEELLVSSIFFRFAWLGFYTNSLDISDKIKLN
ncbi:MAG: hypothetical protein COB02_01500 [Candidatus Cloacimonadota bacterium]|nr:MAG: hypothetical protein COB02_01500 [Candidatus Cloacimonadota bacterium]